MNPYEMTFIIRPDRDEDGTRAVVETVTGRITGAGGELIAAIPWNPPRRRMAYPIKDFGDGFYVTTVFRIEPAALRPIENALKLNENILRFLIVQATDLNIKQAQQRVQQQQAAATAQAQQAAPAGTAPQSPAPSTGESQPTAAPEAAPAAPEAAPTASEATPAAPTTAETAPATVEPVPATAEATPAAPEAAPASDAAEPIQEPVTAGTPVDTQE